MNDHIFREYDIRGLVSEDLTEDVVINLGKAVGTFLLRKNIAGMVVGRDCRLSSDRLRDNLISGLVSTGITVTDIGVCHSPLVYFSLFHLDKDGGVMITGSHNPSEYNGFKICCGKTTIHGEDIKSLRALIKNNDFETGNGSVTEHDILAEYIDHICSNISLERKPHVVIDAGNGTGGRAAVPILKRLGCRVTELYCDMDGRFPNHHPDPTVTENLKDLQETVLRLKADVGVGFDGDGDRIGAIDEKADIIWGDRMMIIFARDILKEHPGATFISEVKGSQTFYNDIQNKGGKAIMWKTGHSLIKAKMKEENALLAGEMSGHMFFAHRYFGFDDAVYACCRLVEILSKTDAPLSSLLADVPETFTTPEIRADCPDNSKFSVIENAKNFFKEKYDIIDIDGARINMPGGWGLVRASNTQPVLVLRFEADTEKRLEEIQNEVETVVNRFLKQAEMEEHRPWGYYRILSDEDEYKCKKIVVYPQKRLSLQSHQKRDEHWFVIKGAAAVTLDEKRVDLGPGQYIDIPRGARHRIENTSPDELCFIEIQTGDYFGEDDIERFDDDFGRV